MLFHTRVVVAVYCTQIQQASHTVSFLSLCGYPFTNWQHKLDKLWIMPQFKKIETYIYKNKLFSFMSFLICRCQLRKTELKSCFILKVWSKHQSSVAHYPSFSHSSMIPFLSKPRHYWSFTRQIKKQKLQLKLLITNSFDCLFTWTIN